jgi:hypothetical protein
MRVTRALFIAVFLIGTGILGAQSAHARVWRCEGKVQFRPCKQTFSLDTNRNSRAAIPALSASGSPRASLRRVAPRRSAGAISVIRQNYRKLSASVGHWYGRIQGNGPAHLYLDIFKQGVRISERYMGNVDLTPRDKDISFNFTGPIPPVAGWTWQVRIKSFS